MGQRIGLGADPVWVGQQGENLFGYRIRFNCPAFGNKLSRDPPSRKMNGHCGEYPVYLARPMEIVDKPPHAFRLDIVNCAKNRVRWLTVDNRYMRMCIAAIGQQVYRPSTEFAVTYYPDRLRSSNHDLDLFCYLFQSFDDAQ